MSSNFWLNITVIFFALLAETYGAATTASIGCRDENNKIVDFYYLYKLPQDPPAQKGSVKSDGLRYAYKTSNDANEEWIDSSVKINEKTSMPGLTLAQMYGTDTIAVTYNDQMPSDLGKDNDAKGHAKGVLVTDKKQGFWLIHSVPQYPPPLETGSYDYPETGKMFGQSFLCITMSAAEIDKASIQLMMNQVQIYSSRLPDKLRGSLQNLENLIDGTSILILKTVKGVQFTSFAKSSDFQKELYSELVAPKLASNLYVETWRGGRGDNNLVTIESPSATVYPVLSVNISDVNYRFSTMRDHSKWAVSSDDNKSWICVGDINFQKSQAKRGGGTVCQNSKLFSNAYKRIIPKTNTNEEEK